MYKEPPRMRFYDLTKGLSQKEVAAILEWRPSPFRHWVRDMKIRSVRAEVEAEMPPQRRRQEREERRAILQAS